MRQNRRVLRLAVACSIGLALLTVLAARPVAAEGTAQLGFSQRLVDYTGGFENAAVDSTSASLYVDILTAGEVINVSLCGETDSDPVSVEIFDPADQLVFDSGSIAATLACDHDLQSPLTDPVRFTTTVTGKYRLQLENLGGTDGDALTFERVDITVTPESGIDPDPRLAQGRLSAYSWNFSTGSFAETHAADTDYFVLVPGGRPNTDYLWKLDLNNLAGYGYNIVANAVGVAAPYSGYSVPTGPAYRADYQFPLYLGVPAVLRPAPHRPPLIDNAHFVDDAGIDAGISPGTSPGLQDTGEFVFDTDVSGTYAIAIDLNRNGVYGDSGDYTLVGEAEPGQVRVPWQGVDGTGNPVAVGAYTAVISMRLGEYHFIGRDIETSGGGGHASDPADGHGLTIWASDASGASIDTRVYWDDVTILNDPAGTSNTPDGVLASSAAGRHTWGDFTGSGFGNERWIDTYVYGLDSAASTQVVIIDDDARLSGTNATLVVSGAMLPGDRLTVRLSDVDLDVNNSVADSVYVTVRNPTSGESEQLLLLETGPSTGLFEGDLATVWTVGINAAGTSNDGELALDFGEHIAVTYNDQQTAGAGGQAVREAGVQVTPDSDGDGVGDSVDLDDDNDGILDSLEGERDSDGDGLVDRLDPDSDNDGLADSAEAGGADVDSDGIIDGLLDLDGDGLHDLLGPPGLQAPDSDGDGLLDSLDSDADNDGLPDALERSQDASVWGLSPTTDTDGDGQADHLDPDSDDDGTTDAREAGFADADGDGVIDGFRDDDGDGWHDALLALPVPHIDSDGDSLPDWRDTTPVSASGPESGSPTDSVIDTAPNPVTDSGTDTGSGDVVVDSADADADADEDGIPDAIEGQVDSDGDGIVDALDRDSDNDGIPDSVERGDDSTVNGPLDSDGDGLADYLDTDSDDDGISDALESGGGDADGNGRLDTVADTDGDGLHDAIDELHFNHRDSDGDGIADWLDGDADNDGLPDALERGESSPGRLATTLPDTDGDGVPDLLDTDSDDDGLTDLAEWRHRNDALDPDAVLVDLDNDGRIDSLVDLDLDGVHDFLETIPGYPMPTGSSENDSVSETNVDTVVDGDTATDTDTDTATDANTPSEFDFVLPDSDGDGLHDGIDSDSDGDGIPDRTEGTSDFRDTDADGLADHLDADADGDGIFDAIEAYAVYGRVSDVLLDTDGDGEPDVRDVDADGDGRADTPASLDSDGDGIADRIEGSGDPDNDGIPNHSDLDSDNDGIPDRQEYGRLAGHLPLHGRPQDTDGDRIPDYLDLDSDNDGLVDALERVGLIDSSTHHTSGGGDTGATVNGDATDNDGDGRLDAPLDADGDGLHDSIVAGSGVAVDSDADGIPDYRDLDSDDDGLADILRSGQSDVDRNGELDLWVDYDRNGIEDSIDAGVTGGEDVDADGIDDRADSDFQALPDTDGDGIVDVYDVDADGDGLLDRQHIEISAAHAATGGTGVTGAPHGPLQTGLGGSGFGCSLLANRSPTPGDTTGRPEALSRPARDPVFLLLALLGSSFLCRRRHS